jgi:hypothetical protein
MNQKVTTRIVGGLVAVVILASVWIWFENWSKDPENEAKANTQGMIAALELIDRGGRAVVFTPEGEKKSAPAPEGTAEDRELSWGATGAHVFLSSNRGGSAFNIYRWNPATGSFSRRSRGSRSQGAPWFVPDGSVDSLRSGLMVAGGAVQVLDPKLILQRQLLPPLNVGADSQGEEGRMGPMDGIYKDIGESFRDARWGPNKGFIYSVMRREGGEVLVVSPQTPDPVKGTLPPPVPVLAGRRVQIDADATGKLVILIQEFQWPKPEEVPEEFIKDGKVTTPYKDALFVITPDGKGEESGMQPIAIFPEAQGIFGSEVALSPDGTQVAVVLKRRKGEDVEPMGLFSFPAVPGGVDKGGGGLLQGPVSSPSWSPDGKKIVYLKLTGGKNAIYTYDIEGVTEKRISEPDKSYRSPRFSPAR